MLNAENDKNAKEGLFIAICGPSGVGKGTIVNMLRERFKEGMYVLSNTTREPRPGEIAGQQYYFIDVPAFEQGIKEGRFLEWAQVHHGAYYGILREPVEKALAAGKVVIREVDLQGARAITGELRAEQLIKIFIMPENLEVLRKHILGRSNLQEEEVQRRLASAKVELDAAGEFNYRVVNQEGQIEKCFAEIMAIIFDESERRGLL